jgi:SpoIID/LytB domain protein
MLANPPKDLISAPDDPTLWSAVKWLYAIPLKDIEARLKQNHNIGKFKYAEPAEITETGRITKMRFAGSKGEVLLPFAEANFILAAGTLRSNFFYMAPFGKEVIFIGTDTGLGRGLCLDGAQGLARQDKPYREILGYYYPGYKISKEWQQQKSPL